MVSIVQAILYKLKTGVQWRYLPMAAFFGDEQYSWSSVYHHFSKWSKMGAWDNLWLELLEQNKSELDMSNVELDGSHTPCKRGGEAVGYQGRKKSKTTNMLFLTDCKGQPLACSNPIAGNHNDAFKLEATFQSMLSTLEEATVPVEGLFLNADSGFDTTNFRQYCESREIITNIARNKRNKKQVDDEDLLDELLYSNRFVVERTNAWLDAFKTLLVRFETNDVHWKAWHMIAFAVILLRL